MESGEAVAKAGNQGARVRRGRGKLVAEGLHLLDVIEKRAAEDGGRGGAEDGEGGWGAAYIRRGRVGARGGGPARRTSRVEHKTSARRAGRVDHIAD